MTSDQCSKSHIYLVSTAESRQTSTYILSNRWYCAPLKIERGKLNLPSFFQTLNRLPYLSFNSPDLTAKIIRKIWMSSSIQTSRENTFHIQFSVNLRISTFFWERVLTSMNLYNIINVIHVIWALCNMDISYALYSSGRNR